MTLWILDLDDTVAHTTRDMRGDPARASKLRAVRGARVFLRKTKARGDRCVLITLGEWPLQMQKLKQLSLGIDYSIISPPRDPNTGISIELPPDAKQGAFQRLSVGIDPQKVVIVGDRLDRDIAIGKRLGLTTVRMRLPGGKYSALEPDGPEETPDFTVADFFALMKLPVFTET